MRIISDQLYLETEDLMAYGVPQRTIYDGMHMHGKGRNSWRNISAPEGGSKKLIAYDSIPAQTKEKYNLPSREHFLERGRRGHLADLIHILPTDENFYLSHPHTQAHAKHFARHAAWLRFLGIHTTATTRRLGLQLNNLQDLYGAAIELMADEKLPEFRITNPAVLGKRVREFKDTPHPNNLRLLLPSLLGNANARKLDQPQIDLLITLHGNGRKLSIEQTYQLYTAKARELVAAGEWSPKALVSIGTVKNTLNDPEIRQQWAITREGLKAYRSQYERKITRMAASFPNAKWEMDGSKLNQAFYNPEATSDRDRYVHFNLFVVLDEHSQLVLGWSLGKSEDRLMVLEALRMACARGHRPHQLVSDRGAANMSAQMVAAYQVIADKFTPAEAGRATSKSRVENFFHRLGDKVLKHRPGYTGGNITTTSNNSQANPELLRLERKLGHLRTIAEAQEEVAYTVELWNRSPLSSGKSPLELYESGMATSAERQLAHTKGHEVQAFYFERAKGEVPYTYTFGTKGLVVQEGSERFYFDVENEVERPRLHLREMRLRIAPDWSEAYLYTADGKPLLAADRKTHLVAQRKTIVKSALADYLPGDAELVHQQNELREKQLRRMAQLSEDARTRTQERGFDILPLARGGEYNKELLDERKVITLQDRLLLDDYDPEKELAAQRRRLTLRKENDTSTED